MPGFEGLGRMLVLMGIMLAAFGLLLMFFGHFNLGRLPGDIVWKRGNFTFFFPLATSILISILLTVILNLVLRR